MKTLNVMGLDFVYKVAIRGFEGVILDRWWNGINRIEISLNAGITNADLIAVDDLIWFDKEYKKVFIVDAIEETLTGDSINYLIIGSGVESLLKDYLILPDVGSDFATVIGDRESVVRSYVDLNVINPVDIDRIQYPVVLGVDGNRGITIEDKVRYGNLFAEIQRVLQVEEMSFELELDLANSQFVFNVLSGSDRTYTQTDRNRILFGLKYGNIAEYTKTVDVSGQRNVAYVGGKGEGLNQTIVKVDNAVGRKKEVFVNQKSFDDVDILIEAGHQTLAGMKSVSNFNFSVLNRQFQYGVDYDLGDYVTVVIDKDHYENRQIIKVQEVYERGNITVNHEFGNVGRSLTGVVLSINSRVTGLETVVGSVGGSSGGNPVGAIIMSVSLLDGYLECDGSAISREAFASLFGLIGTTFGVGDGSTTFNLPNMKGKVVVGQDTGDVSFDVIGEIGGAKTHTLIVDEMPSHQHTSRYSGSGTTNGVAEQGTGTGTSVNGGATGGGQAHNNLQPYIVLKYLIKI